MTTLTPASLSETGPDAAPAAEVQMLVHRGFSMA
jgi:hypothetical protein